MTIKELKKDFHIHKDNGKYIFMKEGGKRSAYKYVATVIKKGRSMYVEGYEPTTKVDVLKEQIKDFVSSLKYDSEYYNPMFSDGLKEKLIVHDYLDDIGFVSSSNCRHGLSYCLKRPSIYGYQTTSAILYISGLDVFNLADEVNIQLATGDYSWISANCKRNEDDIIKTIDSLLKPLMLTEANANINTAKDMKYESVDIMLNKLNGLNIEKKDMKSYLKDELQKIVDTL